MVKGGPVSCPRPGSGVGSRRPWLSAWDTRWCRAEIKGERAAFPYWKSTGKIIREIVLKVEIGEEIFKSLSLPFFMCDIGTYVRYQV